MVGDELENQFVTTGAASVLGVPGEEHPIERAALSGQPPGKALEEEL